jgi:hypothetical protein
VQRVGIAQEGLENLRKYPRGLAGEVGKYVVEARRNGKNWYLAAITDRNARELPVPLGSWTPAERRRDSGLEGPLVPGRPLLYPENQVVPLSLRKIVVEPFRGRLGEVRARGGASLVGDDAGVAVVVEPGERKRCVDEVGCEPFPGGAVACREALSLAGGEARMAKAVEDVEAGLADSAAGEEVLEQMVIVSETILY